MTMATGEVMAAAMVVTAVDTATASTPFPKVPSVTQLRASEESEQRVEAAVEMERMPELAETPPVVAPRKATPSRDTHRTDPAELQIGGRSFDADE